MTNLSTGMPGSATDVVVSRAAGTGPATWAMGMLFERLVGAEDTGSLLGASIVTQPPGQASPLHVHTREAEAWFLLQGAMTYRAGERLVRMTAGDFIYLPRQVPHAFQRCVYVGCAALYVGKQGAQLIFGHVPPGQP